MRDNSDVAIGIIDVISINDVLKSGRIGYIISKDFWGKGITSEAFKAVINFLFNKIKFNRIEALYDVKNVSSGKVMQKCGLKFEGVMRQGDYNSTGIIDVAIYSILAEEYDGTINT